MAKVKRTQKQQQARLAKQRAKYKALAGKHLDVSSEDYQRREAQEKAQSKAQKRQMAENKKARQNSLLGRNEQNIVSVAEGAMAVSDFLLPTALLWKADSSSTSDKVIDAFSTIPMLKWMKGMKTAKSAKKFTKQMDKMDKVRGKKPKIKTKKQKKADKKAKKKEGKIPKKSLLLKSLKGKDLGTVGVGGMGAVALSNVLSGLFDGSDDRPKQPVLSEAEKPTSAPKSLQDKVFNFTDKKPVSALKTDAVTPAKKAMSLVNQCCTDDPQEKIKRHAFMSSVEDSLKDIAKAETGQAEDIKKDTKKKQNEQTGILSMMKGLSTRFDEKSDRITTGKAVKFGIYAWLGTMGVFALIGWLKKVGGFEGLKKWLVEAITKKFDSLMDVMREWWNDNVVSNIQSILLKLGVVLDSVFEGTGSSFKSMAKGMDKARLELSTESDRNQYDEQGNIIYGTNTSIQQGLVGAKDVTGARDIKSIVTEKWYKQTTSDYGKRTFKGKTEDHTGIDIRAKVGTPITALDYGIVLKAHHETRSGNMVTVYNPRTKKRLIYMHLDKIDPSMKDALKEGTVIKPGDPIGLSGKTGSRVEAPHIHISVKQGQQGASFVDPMTYIESVSAYNLDNGALAGMEAGVQRVEASAVTNNTNVTPAPTPTQQDYVTSAEYQQFKEAQDSINKETHQIAVSAGEQKTSTLIDGIITDPAYL